MKQGILFVCIALFPFLYSCNSDKVEALQPYKGPLIEVDTVETLYTDSSRLKIRMRAPKELELDNGNKEFPKGINIEFYDENQVMTSTLTSNYGKYNKEKIYIP